MSQDVTLKFKINKSNKEGGKGLQEMSTGADVVVVKCLILSGVMAGLLFVTLSQTIIESEVLPEMP